MKKVCWLLILVLLLACFVGCKAAPIVPDQPTEPRSIESPDGTLSDWMKEEIEDAYKNVRGVSYTWLEDSPNLIRYYGTENGYVLIFEKWPMDEGRTMTIADKVFSFNPSYFMIFAYKDGQFIRIEEAYEKGLITKAAIDKAWEIHQEYESNS